MDDEQIEPLKNSETELHGSYVIVDGESVEDRVTQRIECLTKHHLKRVAIDESGWLMLFRDPKDGRLWEHGYFQKYGHGIGPPSLKVISHEEARSRYKFKD
jgi:hypothetical protein